MKNKQSDIALLEDALATIEEVLARADSEMQGVPYFGPTSNGSLEELSLPRPTEVDRLRSSAEQSAINICLSSAAALVNVSQALMSHRHEQTADEVEREWKTLIAYTKTASRSAYRAALILAAQKSVRAAIDSEPSDELLRRIAH